MIQVTEQVLKEITAHAETSPNKEICGLITTAKRRMKYIPCRNIAEKHHDFVIHPEDYADAEDKAEIICIVHSHTYVNPNPTPADLVQIEKHGLPWLIINYPTLKWTLSYPTGYEAPYLGRPFVHGIFDCYSIWRDHYKRELNIEFEDYHRDWEWWLKGQNLYEDHMEEMGMVKVDDLKKHDVIMMQVGSPVINHVAIYLGDGLILQHIMGKLSSKDVYGGWYRKITVKTMRHKSLL